MSEPNPNIAVDTTSAIKAAIAATPQWVLGLAGGMVTLSVCIIAILQLGGFSGPIGRIMNAKAAQIERAAESITSSSIKMEAVVSQLEDTDRRLNDIERRVEDIEDTHLRLGVK